MQALHHEALLQAIATMQKENTRVSREAVLDLIISGIEFMSPVTISNAEEPSAELHFELIPNQEGQPFFPVFTSWEELRKLCGPKNQQTVTLNFDHYAGMILRDHRAVGFVIDPFGCCLSFDREMISHLVQRKATQTSIQ